MGLQGSFQRSPIIIDDNTKMELMKMQRTPKSNIDEQIFTNPISVNIDETKWLTRGIEVLKLGKMSSQSEIEDFKNESDERYQIDKGYQLEKNVQISKEY